jgi:hypothetical protein
MFKECSEHACCDIGLVCELGLMPRVFSRRGTSVGWEDISLFCRCYLEKYDVCSTKTVVDGVW